MCGPRVWLDQLPVERVLAEFPKGTILVQGKARGLDMIAGYVGELLGFEGRPCPVDHALDGPWPGAGPARNRRMLKREHPDPDGVYVDVGIAFKLQEDLSKGTAGMSQLLQSAHPKIEYREVWWTGKELRIHREPPV